MAEDNATDTAVRLGIMVSGCEPVSNNPNMDDAAGMHHWRVTLAHVSKGDRRRKLTTYFSQGSAYTAPPTATDVLDCLLSDAATIENAGDFADFCSELGYDEDSRRAERIYKTCVKQTNLLKRFLGVAYQSAVFPESEES